MTLPEGNGPASGLSDTAPKVSPANRNRECGLTATAFSIIPRIFSPDVVFILGFSVLWATLVIPIVLEERHPYDGYRDIAAALDFQLAREWRDPAYRSETPWHPPLGPWIAALVADAFGTAPDRVYLWSQFLVNGMIPAGLYLVVRLAWGPMCGLVSVAALLFAMPWWREYVVMPLASWQALIAGWVLFLLYAWSDKKKSRWGAALTGSLLGLSVFFHPLVPGILLSVFLLNALWDSIETRRRRGSLDPAAALLSRTGILSVTAIAIGCGLLATFQHGPILNRLPREFIDLRMKSVYWAAMNGNLWLWGTGLIGAWTAAQSRTLPGRLLVSALLVTLVGQGLGYLRLVGISAFPVIVPHQFQMHFQVAWSVCIGLGIITITRFLAARIQKAVLQRAGTALMYSVSLGLTGLEGFLAAPEKLRHMPPRSTLYPPWLDVASVWINENTESDEVFMLSPELAFLWLGPTTARKVWLLPMGHSNPRVNWRARAAVADELTQSESLEAFCRVAREHGIDYAVLTLNCDAESSPVPVHFPRNWIPLFALQNPTLLENSAAIRCVYVDPRGILIVRIPRDGSAEIKVDG